MFDDERGVREELDGMAETLGEFGRGARGAELGWREIDRALRRVARRRATLDVEEAAWLRRARDGEVHRHLGCATLAEYLERVLGYAPAVARDRLRVAVALGELPALQAAMAAGRVAYSAARELTRIATAETEEDWIAAATDRTVREIEAMVSGRRPGDPPDAAPDPALRTRRLTLELSPETYALFAAARRAAEDDAGHALTDDEVIASLARSQLAPAPHVGDAAPSRPSYQIAVTRCDDCGRAWQDAAGQTVEIGAAAVEQAACDAEHLGRVDGDRPQRIARSIPPATRRAVWRRDRGRCVVPGCRNARYADVHHVVARAAGGDHAPTGLVCLCTAHHRAVHDGRIRISGHAPHALRFTHADGRRYGQPPPTTPPPTPSSSATSAHPHAADADRTARTALVRLGFSDPIAREAIARARREIAVDTPLEALLRAALRACPRPVTAPA
jgi:hypothetical protein